MIHRQRQHQVQSAGSKGYIKHTLIPSHPHPPLMPSPSTLPRTG